MAKLRHEWCDFFEDPPASIQKLRQSATIDVFTFISEIGTESAAYPYQKENTGMAVLTIKNYEHWWTEVLDFKVRNKVRKSAKSGVELRMVSLNDDFVRGVESIYNESPIRQGRKFFHYGKGFDAIKEELSSFSDRTCLVGAYFQGELIGFMKLFEGKDVLRTIHIIAKLSHREKPVMDGLIAKAVELCEQKKIQHLHYGSWTDGGVGVFRVKHGFVQMDVPRYYVPLNWRGGLMLKLNLHRPMRNRLPKSWVEFMLKVRTKWNSFKHVSDKSTGQSEVRGAQQAEKT